MKRREPPPTNEAVRRTMQGNTKKDTSIEIILRSALWRRGIRFRKNVKTILGTPDIVIKKYHLVVFCDGDFWHGKDLQNLIKRSLIQRGKQNAGVYVYVS